MSRGSVPVVHYLDANANAHNSLLFQTRPACGPSLFLGSAVSCRSPRVVDLAFTASFSPAFRSRGRALE